MDLQEVAKQLGYRGVGGLGGLVAQVLGLHMPKGHKVSPTTLLLPKPVAPGCHFWNSMQPRSSPACSGSHAMSLLPLDSACPSPFVTRCVSRPRSSTRHSTILTSLSLLQVATSNWEAKRLTPRQVQYAALDAFATGHLLRCLGLWHSSPSPCPACKAPLGVPLPPPSRAELTCPEPSCQRRFTTREAMLHHADAKQHPRSARPCQLCGRWCTSCPLREASHRPSITANR